MTGPEHYRKAEALLEAANSGANPHSDQEPRLVAQAQVHATLALAAATGMQSKPSEAYRRDGAWEAVAGRSDA
jgi:hypothetical protein